MKAYWAAKAAVRAAAPRGIPPYRKTRLTAG